MNTHFEYPVTTAQEKQLRKLQKRGYELDYQWADGTIYLNESRPESTDDTHTEVAILPTGDVVYS